MQPPITSIIIPAYNAELYIAEAIESVLNQTITDYEIIIVDDGSTDNTKMIINNYKDKYVIRYCHQLNKGPAAARNFGIQNARGYYVAFLDADDWWVEDKLEKELQVIREYPDAAFVCSDWFCGKYGDEERRSELSEYEVWNHEWATFEHMLRENFVNTSTILVTKEKVIAAGLFNQNYRGAEDRHLWLRLLLQRNAMVIKDVLAFRRYHPQNTSNTRAYMESQLEMTQDLLCWDKIKQDTRWMKQVKKRMNEIQISLAYKSATERRYADASHYYWSLLRLGYKPLHCFSRACVFFALSRILSHTSNWPLGGLR